MKEKIELKSERENKSSGTVNFFNQRSVFPRLSFNVTKLTLVFMFRYTRSQHVLISENITLEHIRKRHRKLHQKKKWPTKHKGVQILKY